MQAQFTQPNVGVRILCRGRRTVWIFEESLLVWILTEAQSLRKLWYRISTPKHSAKIYFYTGGKTNKNIEANFLFALKG